MRFNIVQLILVMGGTAIACSQDESLSDVQKGKELFHRVWKPNDPKAKNGDGLGPMFNENSCAKCHPNGGGDDRRFNVQLLSIRKRNGQSLQRIPDQLNRLMPYFSVGGEQTVILHKNSTDESYNHARRELLGLNPSPSMPDSRRRLWENAQKKKRAKLPPTRVLKNYKDVELIVSERNTPALFGAGLIDKIPRSELDRIAAQQAKVKDGISGRVSVAMDGLVGKFGWRAQTSSLLEFVKGACAAELGLQSPSKVQNQNPMAPNRSLIGYDVSLKELQAMTKYVASINRPVHREVKDLSKKERRGRVVFNRVDCAKCHVENLGGIQGLYSDLLLHDLGSRLADPLPAMPELKLFQRQQFSSGGGYFGSGFFTVTERRREVTTNILQEWRTPPLWGAAHSGPYLHDGRAKTFLEAILLHGGEARNSVEKFRSLPNSDKTALITFLNSLKVTDSQWNVTHRVQRGGNTWNRNNSPYRMRSTYFGDYRARPGHPGTFNR